MEDIENSVTSKELRQRYSTNSNESKPIKISEKGKKNKSSNTKDIIIIASIAVVGVLTITGSLVLLIHFLKNSLDD